MARRWFLEWLLNILNFLLALEGLAMIGYGSYMLVEWKEVSMNINSVLPSAGNDGDVVRLGRPLLFIASLSDRSLVKLPAAWFIYLFIIVGVIICIISCSGSIAATSRSGCCLSCYTMLVAMLILVELGLAAFTCFDNRWEEVIPIDQTGEFKQIKEFLEKHFKIVKWAALGLVISQALAMFLALAIRATTRGIQVQYDSDDGYFVPRYSMHHPLLNHQGAEAAAMPASFSRRALRNDAWSARMREKYALDRGVLHTT